MTINMILLFLRTIARISILTMVLFLFTECIKSNISNKEYKSIKLFSQFQFVDVKKDSLITIKDSFYIHYLNNYVIYQLPRMHYFENEKTNRTIEKLEYTFVIYEKGDKYGLKYDSVKEISPKIINVDSFLNKKAFQGFPFYSINNDIFLEKNNRGKNTFIEKHIYKNKKDISYCDTIEYFFGNKFQYINYSFSRLLDSTRSLKLYRVKYIYNLIPKGMNGKDIPKREFDFELKNSGLNNKNEVITIISKFKAYEKSTGKSNSK